MNDVEVIRTGYLLVFPTPDGPVLLLDSTRLQHALASVLDRCVFYILTIGSDEGAQTKGGTLLNIVSSRKGPMKNMKQKQQQWEFVHKAMPFKFKRCVVVQSFEEGKQILLEFFSYQQSRLLGYTSGIHTDLISKDSLKSTLSSLLGEGFHCSHIPNSLGGDFDYSQVASWARMRMSVEDAMGSAPPKRNVIPRQIIASMQKNASANNNNSTAVVPSTTMSESSRENRDEFVRQRNASYARRFYHRKKLEVMVQQDELAALDRINAKLRAENQRLEGILAQAIKIVFVVQHGGPQLATTELFMDHDTAKRHASGTITQNGSTTHLSSGSSVDTGSSGSRSGVVHVGYHPNAEWHEESQLRQLFMN